MKVFNKYQSLMHVALTVNNVITLGHDYNIAVNAYRICVDRDSMLVIYVRSQNETVHALIHIYIVDLYD